MSDRRPEWRKLESLPSVALREGWLWGQAVHRLAASIERSELSDVPAQVDAMLLAVAFRNVYRAAEWASRTVSPAGQGLLRRALEQVDRELPDAKDVRDMLEHFDEYEAGKGRLQQGAAEQAANEHFIRFERGAQGYIFVVSERQLPVRKADSATHLLVVAIQRAGNLSGSGGG